jgi:transcriptional regulator with PAS, ATPase and Fis domain
LDELQHFGQLVGRSAAMRAQFSLLRRAAATDSAVLIEGEAGTGKEACAEAIHRQSRRKDGPFVIVDCREIPPQLMESELFGYDRGAFSGAVTAKQGAFEAASGGTILLDEVEELPLDLQPRILRAIDRRQVKRIGSKTFVPADVRVVAATKRSLRATVKAERFRSNLYYRLAVVKVHLPPLRDRPEDIPLLVENILVRLGVRDAPEAATLLTPDFITKLTRYRWPGNIRQLRNYIERSVALGDTALPALTTIPPPVPASRSEPPAVSPVDVTNEPFKEARDALLGTFERGYIERQLARHRSVSAAARASGIDRAQFYRLMGKYGLR